MPIILSSSREMTNMQTLWGAQLNPLLSKEIVNGRLIRNIELSTGANVINHGLDRILQGWFITRLRGSAPAIYDTNATNPMPQLTLNLNSSAPVMVDLWVF